MENRSLESLIIERSEAISCLRLICEEYGDNDWPDNLHLADIIDKHLGRHLDAAADSAEENDPRWEE